jgi:UDP:flavonoid glycosyltransferase YjiC (YdhE family)
VARILVASMPFAGHVGPMGALAAELTRRGHQVVAYSGAKYRERFTAAGAAWLPRSRATDFDDADLAATFPRIGNGKGLRANQANVEDVLFGTGAGQAEDILAEARREPFDLLVSDQTAFGAALAAEVLGTRWVTVAVTPLSLTSRALPPVGTPFRPATGPLGRARDVMLRGVAGLAYRGLVDPMLNRMRAGVGLGRAPAGRLMDSLYSPYLVVAQGVAGLEYPRADLPGHLHFIGRLAPVASSPAVAFSPDPELPAWWPDLESARHVVHVTQGTLDIDPADLLKPAVAALAGQDLLVVCTTGGPPALGPVPANVRVARYLPHDRLLPLVDVMVTNGGWGGVLAAVQAGIPLVVAGDTLDKPEVARRVAWSGAGVDLRTGRPDPARIGLAVHDLLTRPQPRQRARELGAALTAAGGTAAAATLIEALLD